MYIYIMNMYVGMLKLLEYLRLMSVGIILVVVRIYRFIIDVCNEFFILFMGIIFVCCN